MRNWRLGWGDALLDNWADSVGPIKLVFTVSDLSPLSSLLSPQNQKQKQKQKPKQKLSDLKIELSLSLSLSASQVWCRYGVEDGFYFLPFCLA